MTINTSSCGLSIAAYGLLPNLILQPSLLLPPYCSSSGEERTPEEVISLFKSVEYNEIEMDAEILAVVGDLELVGLHVKVYVYDWQDVLDSGDRDDEFQTLLQIPHRWEQLVLCFENLEEIPQMLDTLAPCLLTLQDCNLDSESIYSSSDSSVATDSSKKITFPLHTLPTLFNAGILNSLTMLQLNNSYFVWASVTKAM